jgi:hypothetical protein
MGQTGEVWVGERRLNPPDASNLGGELVVVGGVGGVLAAEGVCPSAFAVAGQCHRSVSAIANLSIMCSILG